jgi:DNA primase
MLKYISDVRGARITLRKSLDLVKVVSDDLGPGAATGHDVWWFCPFHGEVKNPSFGVHSQMQIYKCFGCQAGGDAVAWTMNYHGVSVGEAIDRLGTTYGVDLSAYYRPPTKEELEKAKYHQIMEEASKFFSRGLLNNKQMLEWYQSDTGFDIDQLVTYDVGYSTSSDAIIQYLFQKIQGVTQDDITKLEFDNRLMWTNSVVYPIRNHLNQVTRFYCKPLSAPSDFGGKYVGTSQRHPLFTHKLLFGFSVHKKDLKKTGNKLRVCEGFKAAIASDGVAVMGTNIHEEQIDLMREHGIKEIRVAFDGDNAGKAASLRLLDDLQDFEGINLLIVKMPDGMQADVLRKQHGKDAIDIVFGNAVIPIQFFVDHKRSEGGALTIDAKWGLVVELRAHLCKLPEIQLDLTAQYLRDVLGVDPASVKEYVTDLKLDGSALFNRDAEQTVIQGVLLNNKHWSTVKQHIPEPRFFTAAAHQHIYNALTSAHKKARENGVPDSVTVQVVRDEMVIMFPQWPELGKSVDTLLQIQSKYDFPDAMQRVVDLYRRRRGIEQSKLLQASLQDLGKPTNNVLSTFRRDMVSSMEVRQDDTSTPVNLSDALRKELEERSMRKNAIVGHDFTELRDVDDKIHTLMPYTSLAMSGLQKAHQIIISAYSGVGKSLMGLQMATSLAVCKQPTEQVPVLWVALEMTPIEIAMRQVSMITGLNNSRVQAGMFNPEEQDKVDKALDMIAKSQFYIKKPKTGSIDEIFAMIDEHHFKYGIQGVFLDYIQLIASGEQDKGASREQVIGRASKVMKFQVAESMGLFSVCIAQQNRSNYVAGETGKIENMGGSYQISQDADDVILLAEKTPQQMAEAKDRGNRTGNLDKRRGGSSDLLIDYDLDVNKFVSLRWNECVSHEQMLGLSKGLKV